MPTEPPQKNKNKEDSESDNDNDTAHPEALDTTYSGEERSNGKVVSVEITAGVFKPETLSPSTTLLVLGKRRFGKSIFTRWALSKIWQWFPDGGVVFTTTKHNYFWQQHFPDNRVYDGMHWDVIEDILDNQEAKRERRKVKGIPGADYFLIVLDDMISSRHDMRYVDRMLTLFFNGRHYDLFIALCSQDAKGIPPDMRSNCDVIACTYQQQYRQIETIQNDFADFFDDRHTFPRFLREVTRDYHLLCIDQTEPRESANDGVFTIASPDLEVEPFQIGDETFWKEAEGNWEEQLMFYENIKKTDLDGAERQKLLDERWAQSKADKDMRKEIEEVPVTMSGVFGMPEDKWEQEAKNIQKSVHDTTKAVNDVFSFLDSKWQPSVQPLKH